MPWVTTSSPADIPAPVEAFLRARPAEHTLVLTIADVLRRRGTAAFGEASPLLGWWTSAAGVVGGAFIHTAPFPLVLTGMAAQAVPELADALAGAGRPMPGVNGPTAVADAFGAAWCRRTGVAVGQRIGLRLYRLNRLADPDPAPPGRPRVAGSGDLALLVAWTEAFGRETDGPPRDVAGVVEERLSRGGFTLWEVDGAPVAMAGVTRAVAGMVRIAPVYTPEPLRRRGYAAAVTAAVSRAALDAGAGDVVLFTELANPTSNALYQRLGYRPVEDRTLVIFTPVADREPGR